MNLYLNLFSLTKPHLGCIGRYDINNHHWLFNPFSLNLDENIKDELLANGVGNCHGYVSHFQDLLNAQFDRNRDGEIVSAHRPRVVTINEIIGLVKP
jgi:hypothetical protein